MTYTKKLIEVALPLDAINADSVREKSIRHGHPSTLHLWWARRPLATCRAVIFASLVDDPSAHPDRFPTEELQEVERQRLFGIIEELVKWENSNNEAVLDDARREIMQSSGGNPPPLLDPFCGGGSIPLEAQRLGLDAHASDLNPVAVLITKALIEIPPKFAGQPPVNPAARSKIGAGAGWTGAQGLAEDVRYYGQTWVEAGDLESLARVTAGIGSVYASNGMPEEGVQRLRPLLRRLEEQGHERSLAVLYPVMARLYLTAGGRYDEVLAAGERALALARAIGDDRLWAAAALWRSEALNKMGQVDEALRAMEEAIARSEATGQLHTLGVALMSVSCQYEDRGELEQSRRYGERAFAIAERSGDPVLLALMTTRRGMTAFYVGDWRQARVHFERAVAIDREVGLSGVSAYCLHDLGRLELAEGAWAEAAHYLEEGLVIAGRSGDRFAVRELQRALAECDLLAGHAEKARGRLLPLLAGPRREDWVIPPLLARLAWVQVEVGELHEAEATVAQAIRGAQAMTYWVALVDALRVQALVFTRQHRWLAAAHSLQEGLTLAERMPYPHAEARLLHVYGEMHLQRGEPHLARERLEAAQAIFRRLGARKDAERVEQALADLPRP